LRQRQINQRNHKLFRKYLPHFQNELLRVCDRKTGKGSDYLKAHLPVHYSNNGCNLGSFEMFNSRIIETGHIAIKSAARSTQKRISTLDAQTARNATENEVIDRAYRDRFAPIPDHGPRDKDTMAVSTSVYHPPCTVGAYGKKHMATTEGMFRSRLRSNKPLSPANWLNALLQHLVFSYLKQHILPYVPSKRLFLFNYIDLHYPDSTENFIFRSDPMQHWHDWAYICWGDEDWNDDMYLKTDELEVNGNVIPGRILAIFKVDANDLIPFSSPLYSTLSRGGYFCLTTKCLESIFCNSINSVEFAGLYPESENYLARTEQDLVLFSHVHEEKVRFPSNLSESQSMRNDGGSIMIEQQLPKLHLISAQQIIASCLAVPYDIGEDLLHSGVSHPDCMIHMFYSQWLFVRPQQLMSSTFEDIMYQRHRKARDESKKQRSIDEIDEINNKRKRSIDEIDEINNKRKRE